MIENKRFIEISVFAIILIVGLGFLSFYIGEKTEQRITGQATAQAFILETPPINCTVELREGLNFVSFFCDLGITSINESLVDPSNQTLDFSAVYSYVANKPNNSWNTYKPDLPTYIYHDLQKITRYRGYWLDMNTSENYSKEGLKFQTTTISLKPGWNMVSYPTNLKINISLGLLEIAGKYSLVESFQKVNISENGSNLTNFTYKWLIYEPGINNSLQYLEPMKAYFINATEETTWTINW